MKTRLQKEGRRLDLTAPFGELDPVSLYLSICLSMLLSVCRPARVDRLTGDSSPAGGRVEVCPCRNPEPCRTGGQRPTKRIGLSRSNLQTITSSTISVHFHVIDFFVCYSTRKTYLKLYVCTLRKV